MRTVQRILLVAILLGIALRADIVSAQSAITSFGRLGTGNGEFTLPLAIATDGQGRFWIGDIDRVQVFDPRGNFLFAFGESGPRDGHFEVVTAIAIDPNGNVWVADGTARVQQFDATGRFLSKFQPQVGDGGGIKVFGLAVDSHGIVYVADQNPGRVQAYARNGTFLFKCDPPAGQTTTLPHGLAVDRNDRLYVADGMTRQVLVYDNRGHQVSAFGGGQVANPLAVNVDPFGIVQVIDGRTDQQGASVQKFDRNGRFLLKYAPEVTSPLAFRNLVGVTVDPAGTVLSGDRVPPVYVLDADAGRVIKLDLLGNYLFSWGSFGQGDGQFVSPNDIAIDRQSEVFVTDVSRTRPLLQHFTLDGALIGKFATSATNVAVDPLSNFLLLADSEHDQILVYLLRGPTLRQTIGRSGTGDGEFRGVRALAADGRILYVADTDNHRVQLFRTAAQGDPYEFVRSITYQAERPFAPHGIAPVRGGFVVADTANAQLVKFTLDGQVERIIGSRGLAEGQFDSPQFVAADSEGGLFVSDNHTQLVQKFSPDGRFLYSFGDEGTAPNNLNAPEGVLVQAGRIYVVDGFNGRVAVFAEDLKRDRDRDTLVGINDLDQDGDGITDALEGDGERDTDGDGVPDALDLDSDQDGICDVLEVGLVGTDDCLLKDVRDDNGNGLADSVDPDAGGSALVPRDTDADGIPDYLDGDADNDGRCDVRETRGGIDANRDCVYDDETDLDGDGLADALYPINGKPLVLIDSDRDGLDDSIDATADSSANDSDSCAITAPRAGSCHWLLLGLLPLLILARRKRRPSHRH